MGAPPTQEELRQQLQNELNAKLEAGDGHALVYMFEDDTAYITNENKEVIAHDADPTGGPPTGGMNVIRWYTGSPICIWYSGKRR